MFKVIPFQNKEISDEINFILDDCYNKLLDEFDIIAKNIYKKHKDNLNLYLKTVKEESKDFAFSKILFDYYTNNNIPIHNLYYAMHNIVYSFSAVRELEEQEISFFIDFLLLLDNTIKKNFITYSINIFIENTDVISVSEYIRIVHTLLEGRRISTFQADVNNNNLTEMLKDSMKSVNKKIMVKGKSIFSNTLRTYTKTNQYIFYKQKNHEVGSEVNFELIESINTDYSFNLWTVDSGALERVKDYKDLLLEIDNIIKEENSFYQEKVNTLSSLLVKNKNVVSKNKNKIISYSKSDEVSFYLADLIDIFFQAEKMNA